MWALLDLVLAVAGIFVAIGYFFLAGFFTSQWTRDNDQARNGVMGLFIVIFVLLLVLLTYVTGYSFSSLSD